MTTTKQITGFQVSWTADHEQYYLGHSLAFSPYTHSGQGCGETLREAFEDALDNLAEQDIDVNAPLSGTFGNELEQDMLVELTSQVKDPAMLDWDIVQAECPAHGKHAEPDSKEWSDGGALAEDCTICAGEWHFYVNVDVRLEDLK